MRLYTAVDAAGLCRQAPDIAGRPRAVDTPVRITDHAATLPGCAAADLIRVTQRGQLQITASSDPGLSGLTEKAWQRWPHTPIADRGPADLEMLLQRSSYMQQLSAHTAIVQELILPLRTETRDHGYLRLLFSHPSAAANRPMITAFCGHAALALDQAALLTQLEERQSALAGPRGVSRIGER